MIHPVEDWTSSRLVLVIVFAGISCVIVLVFQNVITIFNLLKFDLNVLTSDEKKLRFFEILQFCLVGLVSLIVEYLLLYTLTEFIGIYYLLSSGISYTMATVLNYYLCVKFVFEGATKQTLRQSVLFISSSLIGLVLNQVCMMLFVEYLRINYLVAKLYSTIVGTVWNYLMKKRAILGRENA